MSPDSYFFRLVLLRYWKFPCVDPLNKRFPKCSPNKVDICDVIKKFLDWNDAHHLYSCFTRIMTTTKKPVINNADYESFYGIEDEGSSITPASSDQVSEIDVANG